mmetsp:Transcript_22038/g.32559  ORF Transcript_22038/g.32559 Transcript_22038/m.32559 type:complete len:401 (-) Transcript_22038:95-1297(-)
MSSEPTTVSKIQVCSYYPGRDTKNGVGSRDSRVNQLEAALIDAKKNTDGLIDGDESVLPIFLAPEWFFRKQEADDDEDKYFNHNDVLNIMEALKEISKNSPKTLIFAGSILWSTKIKNPEVATKKSKKVQKEIDLVYNTAPVFCNGEIVHYVHKQYWGHDTGKQLNLRETNANSDEVFAFQNLGQKKENEAPLITILRENQDQIKSSENNILKGTFSHRGLKFGLEVCADHVSGALKKQVGDEKVDVHVVVSCGVTMHADNAATTRHGVVIGCDSGKKKFNVFRFIQNGVITEGKKENRRNSNREIDPDEREFIESDANAYPGSIFFYKTFLTCLENQASQLSIRNPSAISNSAYKYNRLKGGVSRQQEERGAPKRGVNKFRTTRGGKAANRRNDVVYWC